LIKKAPLFREIAKPKTETIVITFKFVFLRRKEAVPEPYSIYLLEHGKK